MGSGSSRSDKDKDKDEDLAPHTLFSPSQSSRAGPGRKGQSAKEREEKGKQSGHWQPKVPRVSNQSLSEVLEQQRVERRSARTRSFGRESMAATTSPEPSKKSGTTTFDSVTPHPWMPSGVVHGGDAADMEDELLDPGQSWNLSRLRPDVLPGMPMPPDRKIHEDHIQRLECYREQVSREPAVVEEAVKAKRVGKRVAEALKES